MELVRLRAQLMEAAKYVAEAEAVQQGLGRKTAALAHLQRLPAEVQGLKVSLYP